MPLFSFARARAEREIADPAEGAIWPINAYVDADELNSLLEAAQGAGIIARTRSGAQIYVYPLSITEPAPLLAVDLGIGVTVLGHELGLCEGEDEAPIAFTLRLLADLVDRANALAGARLADVERLDRIAAFLDAHRPWIGGDVCDFLAAELVGSGRRLLGADE
ncbi:MAG TPA: hypothetical protein VHU86_04510 [Solirubrobacterales bacterium]|jgi:hypothetical protein|nr:hypothetical protein [Solirubrobacterales bacterium]